MIRQQQQQCLLILSLLTLTNAFTLQMTSSTTTLQKPKLSKQSTALDVLKELNNSNKLSPYVQTGGTAIITGASSGIGFVTAETLALSGMNVVFCCRDVSKGEKAKEKISASDRVRVQHLDLADLSSVQDCVAEILEKEGTIDLLVNNAGVMAPSKKETTKQNFEMQFGTNHVGHHMLTRLLLPYMNEEGRVVTVASEAHRTGGIDCSDLNYEARRYSPWGAYGQSKLANILFAKALDDRLMNNNIRSVSLHPGVIRTQLWRNTPSFFQAVNGLIMDKSIEQGAATSVYCSLVKDGLKGGEYVMDCKVAQPNEKGKDESGELREELWEMTEKMIEEAGYQLPKKLL